MPGKQHLLRLPRYTLIIVAAALLVGMVAWVAVRSAGPSKNKSPMLIVPKTTTSVVPAAAYATPFSFSPPPAIPPPSLSSSPASSALPSGRVTSLPSSASPSSPAPAPAPSSPSPSPSPSKTVASTTPPAPVLTAAYRTTASWEQGFIGWVRITNTGDAAANWSVKLRFPDSAGVRVGAAWNASTSTSGTTVTFSGGPLAAGATIDMGFSADKSVRRAVSPSSCTVAGIACD